MKTKNKLTSHATRPSTQGFFCGTFRYRFILPQKLPCVGGVLSGALCSRGSNVLQGLNHITIAVNDLEESFVFYIEVLGMTPKAKWSQGAYLLLGELWFCLSCGKAKPSNDYSHIAFDVSANDFPNIKSKLLEAGIKQWKQNKSEGESLYILDPNGHKLELHVGNLDDRLKSLKAQAYADLQLY